MVQIFGSAALILLICNVIGQLWVSRWEEYQDSIWMATLMGMLTLFAAFQAAAVPAIWMKRKLSELVLYMTVVIALLCVLSVIHMIRSRGAYYVMQVEKIKRAVKDTGSLWLVAAAVLILIHTYYGAFYDKQHQDDVRYVGVVVDAVATDEMLMYHPGTGDYLGEIQSELVKDAMAPLMMFWAMWCKMLNIYPSTFMHIVVSLFMMPLAYGTAYLLGRKLSRKKTSLTGMFLCAYCLLNLTNHVLPIEGISVTIQFMRWGKSVMYCILVPLLILFMMEIMDSEKPWKMYLRLELLLYGGCMASVMCCVLLPVATGIWALCDAVRVRSLKSFGRFLIPCLLCIPALVYGLLYYYFSL